MDDSSEVSSRMSTRGGLRRDRAWYSKRVRRRLVYKNGECNTSSINIKKRRQRFLSDIFTTLVDIKWRWNLLIFILAFTVSWLLFALIWWLISFSHGDLDKKGQEGYTPCVIGIEDFTTALLFSIETQHTIGYGGRMTTNKCPEAVIIMMFQSCFGVIIQALMTGLVFAKLSRPKKRAETLMFSKNAVVCRRDRELCLLFRVGDMRRSHIIEAQCRAILIKKKVTLEGEILPLAHQNVTIGAEDGTRDLFLVWPIILQHRIDRHSPFWNMSSEDLHTQTFELIIILEGVVESTGMTTQARTSYLPGEILWGQRFERLITFQKENGEYIIDYSRFNNTIKVDCPRVSAAKQAENNQRSEVPCNSEDELFSENENDPSSIIRSESNLFHDSSIQRSSAVLEYSTSQQNVSLQTDFEEELGEISDNVMDGRLQDGAKSVRVDVINERL